MEDELDDELERNTNAAIERGLTFSKLLSIMNTPYEMKYDRPKNGVLCLVQHLRYGNNCAYGLYVADTVADKWVDSSPGKENETWLMEHEDRYFYVEEMFNQHG